MIDTRPRAAAIDPEVRKGLIACQAACPAHTNAQGYVNAIAEGRFQDAYNIARQPNPLASTCGRVCGAPCETACRRGRVDRPIAIRALKRFVTEKYGVEGHVPMGQSELRAGAPASSETAESVRALSRAFGGAGQGKNVAVVGAGPAGLTAAHDLALMGYSVTIFEALPQPGGMWQAAIPGYRLPRQMLAREVEAVGALGVEVETGLALGRDFSLESLRRGGYPAVFIATGADRSRKLSRPEQGIFAEGDVTPETVAVIDAVAAGHKGAALMDEHLRHVKRRVVTHWKLTPVPHDILLHEDYSEAPRRDPARVSRGPELEGAFDEETAMAEARRCLRCHIQTVYDGELCLLCGACVDICPKACLKIVRLDHLENEETVAARIRERYGLPLQVLHQQGEATLSLGAAVLKDESQCIRCGLCARRCPTGALSMHTFTFEEELVYDPVP